MLVWIPRNGGQEVFARIYAGVPEGVNLSDLLDLAVRQAYNFNGHKFIDWRLNECVVPYSDFLRDQIGGYRRNVSIAVLYSDCSSRLWAQERATIAAASWASIYSKVNRR